MNKRITLAIFFASVPIILVPICIVIFYGAFLLSTSFPRTYRIEERYTSEEGAYQIHEIYADYGGSYGTCKDIINLNLYKYHLGRACGGIHTHFFIINKKNPFEVYQLELDESLDTSNENFEMSTQGYILWDNQTIYY
jgi:hypothetical protein